MHHQEKNKPGMHAVVMPCSSRVKASTQEILYLLNSYLQCSAEVSEISFSFFSFLGGFCLISQRGLYLF